MTAVLTPRARLLALLVVVLVYLHNTLPHLTMMPRVNLDEPWLMERAYQVMETGVPSQPMYGLNHGYMLQVGFPYLLAGWMKAFGVGLLQARCLGVVLGLGIIVMVASLGRRLADGATGVVASLFLASDSNFLGGVRNARTDIPAVFFITAALTAYAIGRERRGWPWFVASGLSAGLAMLCHGNAFWVAIVIALWIAIDRGPRGVVGVEACGFAAGTALALGPYIAVLALNWAEVQRQVASFASDRVPGINPAFLLQQMTIEVERYQTWYFGLVTNSVPNPFLWLFQAAAIVGVVLLAGRTMLRRRAESGATGDPMLLTLIVTGTIVFAAFINNKTAVYLPHLLVGLSLAAGAAVVAGVAFAAARFGPRQGRAFATLFLLFTFGYSAAAVGYYEKWYSSVAKSELVPYERTVETLRALVPDGPKALYGSPHFWVPFRGEPATTFVSYDTGPPARGEVRPVYLLVDESQWLFDMNARTNPSFRRAWLDFITTRCALDAMALGTAYGTIALYKCGGDAAALARSPRIIGGATTYTVGERLSSFDAAALMNWPRYEDPRRRATDRPDVALAADGVRIAGSGWPGVIMNYATTPASAYLVRVTAREARDGDLLYLGTWMERQVLSLSGAAASGMPAPLKSEPWFPSDRAFIATAPRVQLLIYSEAPETDFRVSSVEIYRLLPATSSAHRP